MAGEGTAETGMMECDEGYTERDWKRWQRATQGKDPAEVFRRMVEDFSASFDEDDDRVTHLRTVLADPYIAGRARGMKNVRDFEAFLQTLAEALQIEENRSSFQGRVANVCMGVKHWVRRCRNPVTAPTVLPHS